MNVVRHRDCREQVNRIFVIPQAMGKNKASGLIGQNQEV
jgi:hypothetical protein